MPTETYQEWCRRTDELLAEMEIGVTNSLLAERETGVSTGVDTPILKKNCPGIAWLFPNPEPVVPQHRIEALFANAKYQLWGRAYNLSHRDSRAQAVEFVVELLGELGIGVTG